LAPPISRSCRRHFFARILADRLRAAPAFSEHFRGVVAVVAVEGLVADPGSGSRADGVRVYGVDDRFWAFHGQNRNGPADREALFSPALAARLAVEKGTAITVRVQRQSAVPLELLQGRKEDLGRTLNLTISEIVPADALGEFSLAPVQGDVFAVFVRLATIQPRAGSRRPREPPPCFGDWRRTNATARGNRPRHGFARRHAPDGSKARRSAGHRD
jgi:hypothetical protein